MALVQVSRIKHRQGQLSDLPNYLETGELGWTIDARRLFVGNKTADGAPTDENVEVLTEYSNQVPLPPYRLIQNTTPSREVVDRLRDFASINDFGFKDATSDSERTEVIQEAVDRLYGNNGIGPKILYFPEGTYNVSTADYDGTGTSGIRLYPNTHFIGAGPGRTIFNSSASNEPVMRSSDDRGQTGANIGNGFNPDNEIIENITLNGMTIRHGSSSPPLVRFDRSRNVMLVDVEFEGNSNPVLMEINRLNLLAGNPVDNYYFYSVVSRNGDDFVNLVDIVEPMKNITFDGCRFKSLTNGITLLKEDSSLNATQGVQNLTVKNSRFTDVTGTGFKIESSENNKFNYSVMNFFDNVGTGIDFASGTLRNVSHNDSFNSTTTPISLNDTRNSVVGNEENYVISNLGSPKNQILNVGGPTTLETFEESQFNVIKVWYSILQNGARRFGQLDLISDGSNVQVSDSYDEDAPTDVVFSATTNSTTISLNHTTQNNQANLFYEYQGWTT